MSAASLNAARPTMMEYDEILVWIILSLLSIGLVMVYSASVATAEASKFTGFWSEYYLLRHGLYILIGITAGAIAFQLSLHDWQKLAPYLFLLGVLLLVLIPGIGREVNGSRRWLSLLGINLQPSELSRYSSGWQSRCRWRLPRWLFHRLIACSASSASWIRGPILMARATS